ALCADRGARGRRGRQAQPAPVPDHPALPQPRLRLAHRPSSGACAMALMLRDLLVQGAQMALVLLAAPLLTGVVRALKARLVRRKGPSIFQPYRDLLRL